MTKVLVLIGVSVGAGYAAFDDIHSYLLGVSIATAAVWACYSIAFASMRFPQFAMGLLLLGTVAKLTVTAIGVAIGVSFDLISSPLVFCLTYLFYIIAMSFLMFSYKDKKTNKMLASNPVSAATA
ncbi:NADH:ubiquinone oxidoreductase [Vibrio hippocampi]|nr:NADH:ubiquinone oxidoreductase [Vibrio hippocampi]